jgi:16S rRNA C967 or C1407 C5-methylase (RsmB/RsmF family)
MERGLFLHRENLFNEWQGFIDFPPDVETLLKKVYGKELPQLSSALAYPPSPFVIRVNFAQGSRIDLVRSLKKYKATEMDWQSAPHAVVLPWKGPNNLKVSPNMKKITANTFAAESVMVGSHLYSPGVFRTPKVNQGEEVVVTDPQDIPVAIGELARMKGTKGFSSRERGIFVKSTKSIFTLPPLNSLPEHASGLFFSQSLPSMIAAQFTVAGLTGNDRILDFCAAPGGKTTYMAQLAPTHQVVAVDRSKNRLELLANHIVRMKLKNIKIVPQTLSQFRQTQGSIKVRRILLDPPCSALGLRPRLSCTIDSRSIFSLANYQAQLLKDATACLQTSGYLVYSTCTITQEENEDNIRPLIADNVYEEPVTLSPRSLRTHTIDEVLNDNPSGVMIRFDPVVDHTPGHFLAVLRKR